MRAILLLLQKLNSDRYPLDEMVITKERIMPRIGPVLVKSNQDTKTIIYVRNPSETHHLREIVIDAYNFLRSIPSPEFPYISRIKEGLVEPIQHEFDSRGLKNYRLGSDSIMFFDRDLNNTGRKRTINRRDDYPLLAYGKKMVIDYNPIIFNQLEVSYKNPLVPI